MFGSVNKKEIPIAKNIKVDDWNFGFLLVQYGAILKIVVILTTFMFWFAVASIALFLVLFQVIPFPLFEQLPQLFQILSLIGVSPLLLTALSYRFFAFVLERFIKSYREKHFVNNS
ncbi:MAG: hypothetical protein CV087_23475 [Candidatus Brocadia sp. WS118]|nr:MAG: hypothetical protein CV087_23475 [Candidatus Brocadia sp. WS118]